MPQTPASPLRVAFIGTGQMARLHLKALKRVATPHTVVAACDLSDASAAEFAALAPDAQPYTSVETMLAEVKPDMVHVVTPAGRHFEAARQVLLSGASVYVEKPFVETADEARALLAIADERDLVVCAGHQLVREHAFEALCERAATLGPLHVVDSEFQFFPPRLRMHRAGPHAKAAQLLDILPHPLYALVELLERFRSTPEPITLECIEASPTEVHATLRSGAQLGRLLVSLEARPVASTLSVRGAAGSATADLMRATLLGVKNAGTGPLEKILNPLIEGLQAQVRSTLSVVKRILFGGDYPGLAELIGDCYAAAAGTGPKPLSHEHLETVTAAYERIATAVRTRAEEAAPEPAAARPEGRLAVVTGARGFFGRELTRALAGRGFRVRGVSRGPDRDNPWVHEWKSADLGLAATPDLFAGASVVIHAAAETAGGYEAQERNSVGATGNVLAAMQQADATKLIHVSSISTLRVPRTPWERQDESTPLAHNARILGPYAWGKTASEELVQREAASAGIATRVIRPGMLIDWKEPEVPGLVGKRLFGEWHLGLGRPGLPFGVYDVEEAADIVAWMAQEFDQAPPVLNMNDDRYPTRRSLLKAFRARGWRGRMVWVPISALSLAFTCVRWGMALMRGSRPTRLAVWSVLRPRRYRMHLMAEVRKRVETARAAVPPEGAAAR